MKFSQISIKISSCFNKTVVIKQPDIKISTQISQFTFRQPRNRLIFASGFLFAVHLDALPPPTQQAFYQNLSSTACSAVQTRAGNLIHKEDTHFSSARDITGTLNKANSCIEF